VVHSGNNGPFVRLSLPEISTDYTLKDGEVMRIIKAPFPKDRSKAIQQTLGLTSEKADLVCHLRMGWRDNFATPSAWTYQDASLESVAGAFVDTSYSLFDSDALRAFRWPGLHGDLIVREDATAEQKLSALTSLIEKETNTPVEVVHRKMKRTCVVLRGQADFRKCGSVKQESDSPQVQLIWLKQEREGIIVEIAADESRRDSLRRDLEAGRTPPDIEGRIRDDNTYIQLRNQAIALDIELKHLQGFGDAEPQFSVVQRVKAAWVTMLDQKNEELKNESTAETMSALESDIRATKAILARIEESIKQTDGDHAAQEQKTDGAGGGYAVFITTRPLDDAVLSGWAGRLREYGAAGRPDGMGMFNLEGAEHQLGAPIIADADPDAADLQAGLFLVADDVAGWHRNDPGYAEKLTQVLDNLKKQVGGDWRIEKREFDVLSLQPVTAPAPRAPVGGS